MLKHKESVDRSDDAGARIGVQIRDLRKARGITLQQLAAAVDRSVGYLSQVERGVSELPIPVLQRISEMLGVQITWFFHSETQQPLAELGHVVRRDARRELDYTGTGVREELLSPGLSGDLLLLLTTLEPGAQSDSEQRVKRGEEAGFVQSGSLELTIDDQTFNLNAGDSFSIALDETHSIRNKSDKESCVILWVITPPVY